MYPKYHKHWLCTLAYVFTINFRCLAYFDNKKYISKPQLTCFYFYAPWLGLIYYAWKIGALNGSGLPKAEIFGRSFLLFSHCWPLKFLHGFIKKELAKVRLNLQMDNIFLKIQHSVSASVFGLWLNIFKYFDRM